MEERRNSCIEGRVPTKMFGDHLIADHVVVRANIEEGHRGERVALVVKDLRTQLRRIPFVEQEHVYYCLLSCEKIQRRSRMFFSP